ncbi:hypothetical protein ACERJO_18325 [Halalkalibacter sp. AB-rgal2]|uniref:hypothetical protein n=1 Tax=Halalkalibacter sp. AB-rgal2 TaxID=3242695 RepID=UPI00359D6279
MSYNRTRIERIRTNYVNRLTSSTGVHAVEEIEATRPIANETKHPADNFILSYERYYRALQDLKDEFKQFYHHEQELKKAIEQLNANETFIYQTEQLIHKFNNAITALSQYDRVAGTCHTEAIHNILQQYDEPFSEIGLHINEDNHLTLNTMKLLHFLTESKNTGTDLIGRFKSLILKEYYSFLKVKPSRTKMEHAYEPPTLQTKGLMIEEQR